ncbi:MAG: Nramp family divalent metal transporter [Candidatus Atribacteria bacterium]|nr:Nramp family divalent metal transporter [Candidatus Atribacteria bacterium]
MFSDLKNAFQKHRPKFGALEILKYIGPGFLVTVGFIDPGNWASNVSAGSSYGYTLLWMVTFSTLMLIVLQHNAAHLGISTGLCLSEAATRYMKPWVSRSLLFSAVSASISTALAEILGAAIGLNLLFHLPVQLGTLLIFVFVLWMLYANTYRKLEKWIIAFVSIIGLSFFFELSLVHLDWAKALTSWMLPQIPTGSIPIVMSVLGAVVMPHNLFLHSEIIQSRQWNLEGGDVVQKKLKYEFIDTLASMLVGWAINSAMILMAAATFHQSSLAVNSLDQAQAMLRPLLGSAAAVVFGLALFFSGLSSSITAGMAGGSIFAGIFSEPYNIHDPHSRTGVLITFIGAVAIIFLIRDVFRGLIISQMFLSIQLPWTIFLQIAMTSSKKVMGENANTFRENIVLWAVAITVTFLNILLLLSFLH